MFGGVLIAGCSRVDVDLGLGARFQYGMAEAVHDEEEFQGGL